LRQVDAGGHVHSLVLTDIASGWTEARALQRPKYRADPVAGLQKEQEERSSLD
jgi:hypothetical protein